MAQIFTELMNDKKAIIDSVVSVLQAIPQDVDYSKAKQRLEDEMETVNAKKDKLLELSLAGAIQTAEFKTRNDGFNAQLQTLENQLATVQTEEAKASSRSLDIAEIRRILDEELSFTGEINGDLVTTILDKIVVKKGSTKENIKLDIRIKLGNQYEVVCGKEAPPIRFNTSIRDKAKGKTLWKTDGSLNINWYRRDFDIFYAVKFEI